MMEVVSGDNWTTWAITRAKLQSNHHHQPRFCGVRQDAVTISYLVLRYWSLAFLSRQRCLSVIWAFTSTLICRCGYMFSEQYRAVSLHCINSARSVGVCQRPRFRCWSSLWCTPGWTTATACWSASQPTLRRLQSVLNVAARLIFHLKRSDHITDALVSLHWLRVPERIQ